MSPWDGVPRPESASRSGRCEHVARSPVPLLWGAAVPGAGALPLPCMPLYRAVLRWGAADMSHHAHVRSCAFDDDDWPWRQVAEPYDDPDEHTQVHGLGGI